PQEDRQAAGPHAAPGGYPTTPAPTPAGSVGCGRSKSPRCWASSLRRDAISRQPGGDCLSVERKIGCIAPASFTHTRGVLRHSVGWGVTSTELLPGWLS